MSIAIFSQFGLGCARVTFYKDAELKEKTGITYYEAKPFALVTKTKDGPSTQIVYLPDKSRPQYAVYRSGLGSHKFNVAVQNGILTSYGQESDSKIPELIQSVTGLLVY